MFARSDRRKEKLIESILMENYDSYYRMAFSFVHNEADAADIVQNGAYRAIKSAKRLEQDSYGKTWVYRIMLNEVFRYTKKNQSDEVSIDVLAEEGVEPGTEDTYQDQDLQKAIEALDSMDQMMVKLRYFEDLSLEEIASVLDMNLSTVKSRLYRSLKKLRLLMDEE